MTDCYAWYDPDRPSIVYLLHFDRPIGTARHSAQHYIGFVADSRQLDRRLKQHEQGRGAAITAAAVAQGIKLQLADWWRGSRWLERKLKNRKNARYLCPICRARAARIKAEDAERKGQTNLFGEFFGEIPF